MHALEWLKRRGNPIDWPETEKALFSCIINILLYLFFFLVATTVEFFPELQQHSNIEIVRLTGKLALGVITMWTALLFITLRVRHRNPASVLPSMLQIYLFGQPLMLFAVLNGIHTIVTGLLLAATPVFGLILFNNRHVLVATGMIWAEIILIGIGVSTGLLPNAPLYPGGEGGQSLSLVWLVFQVLIGLPAVALGLFIVNSLLSGLRSREQKILELSRRDGLTGVWNRRYLMEMLQHELAVARRSASPLSLIMLDLDFFKKINDRHGHIAGDTVLVMTASALQKTIRETDYVGRYGGEEFIIILPACDADTARAIAERCRRGVESLSMDADGTRIPVSASFGVTTLTRIGDGTGAALVATADEALYEAKAAGRNRVMFRPGDGNPSSPHA